MADGNTVSDFGKEEQREKIFNQHVRVPIEWEGEKINILDTPGFFDFVGEVEEAVALRMRLSSLFPVRPAWEGEPRKAWSCVTRYKLPRMVFVTDMDIDNASLPSDRGG